MKVFDISLTEYYPFLKEYGSVASVSAYLPDTMEFRRPNDRRPCMVLCEGSAYLKLCEKEGEPVAQRLMAMGFNVFLLRYSTHPVHYPAQLLEAAVCFDLIRQNGDAWYVDAKRIGIMGFSAGGHLASLYANAYGSPTVLARIPDPVKPFACVLCYPVISADESIRHGPSFENLLGHLPDAEEEALVSTERLVSADTPQTFLWHTAGDRHVPSANSLRYAEALARYGVPYALYICPYGNHGMITADRETVTEVKENEKMAKNWLELLRQWVDIVFYE